MVHNLMSNTTSTASRVGYRKIELAGIVLTITQWSQKLFKDDTTLRSRIGSGWDLTEAMTKPFGAKRDRKRKLTKCRTVYQYDNDGVLIAEHNGLKGAADTMGVTSSSILSAIKSFHKSCGFRWSYEKR